MLVELAINGFLRSVRTGAEFLAGLRPHSDKSGAAMRVSPVGLLPDVARVREYAAVQARVTHDTPGGVASAETAALTALAPATSMRELLRACVAITGDVDTVATIALAAASRSAEVTDDLPMSLYRGLERGPYGSAYLYDLDRRLLSAVSPTAPDTTCGSRSATR